MFRQSGVVRSFKAVDPVLLVFGSHVLYSRGLQFFPYHFVSHFTPTFYPDILSRHFTPTFYPDILPRHFTPIFYPDILPRYFTPTFYPDIIPRQSFRIILYNGYRAFPGGRVCRGVRLSPPTPHLECRGPRKSRAIPVFTLRVFVA